MKTKKEIRKQKQKDIQFIISAVTSELYNTAYFEYFNTWESNGGMQWFFDECVEITHKVMLSEGSPYLKWLDYWSKTDDVWVKDFSEVTGETCFDWYHMIEARKEFESRYEKDEPTLPIERLEVNFVISMLKDIEVDGETMEHIINEVGLDEQMFRQLIKKVEKYIH